MELLATHNAGTWDKPRWPHLRGQCVVCNEPWDDRFDYDIMFDAYAVSGVKRIPLEQYWPGVHEKCVDTLRGMKLTFDERGVWS